MKIKIIALILIVTLLSNCGYKPIYSSNISSIRINNIEMEQNVLNNKIANDLAKIYSDNDAEREIDIKISSNKVLEIKSKDQKGDPAIYELIISVSIKINNDEKNYKEGFFKEKITFNNINDKFQLSQYQMNLENNLVKKIIERILIYLSENT